jgi:hypothetical protein
MGAVDALDFSAFHSAMNKVRRPHSQLRIQTIRGQIGLFSSENAAKSTLLMHMNLHFARQPTVLGKFLESRSLGPQTSRTANL